MVGLEFDPQAPGYAGIAQRVAKECLARGMLLLPTGVMRFDVNIPMVALYNESQSVNGDLVAGCTQVTAKLSGLHHLSSSR